MTTVRRQTWLAVAVSVATVVALFGLARVSATAAAEAPATWRPFLLPARTAARPAPPPAAGSAEDLAGLAEVVALQAGPQPARMIEYWTSAPGPVRWNEILLARVRLDKLNPVRVSRALALLNTAMHDALVAACDAKIAYPRSTPAVRDGRIRTLATPDPVSSYASGNTAVATAAAAVLGTIFPGRAREFQALADEVARVDLLTGVATRADVVAGQAIGAAVGALAVERGATDGSSAIWDGVVPQFEGVWAPARPFRNDTPLEPTAGSWRPWLMASGSQFRPGPPPAYKSAEWQAEADEIVSVTKSLTDDQIRIARFWADGSGTDTPPGHWMRIAIDLVKRNGLTPPQAARVFAYLGAAQADAFIACWDVKYTYWSGRPTGTIKGYASTIITPNFPSYTSGHSTLSGASSVVLGYFFPRESTRLRGWAEEAALSRLYGGIHWRSDNEVGLAMGRRIGRLAVVRAIGG